MVPRHRDGAERVGRSAGLLAGAGIAVTLVLVAAAVVWPVARSLAETAIFAIVTITAGALAVLGSTRTPRG